MATLARRLSLFDATMIVMGGIVGAGIFMNPTVVAQEVRSAPAALGAWAVGGLFALVGAFIYAELAARRPEVGGQYAYLRDAFHPLAAFLYAWTLLLVSQSGGMAAVAMTFARYFRTLTGVVASDGLIAVSALALLTIVNCFGVRAGSNLQSLFMVLKIGAIALLIGFGFVATPAAGSVNPPSADTSFAMSAFGAALVPVLFAYGGWQTSSFMAGELRQPRRDLPLGLLIGVCGVIALYLLVNIVCLRVLGVDGLAQTATPASDVMRLALGDRGASLIAAGIAISTLGFLSQNLLTGPRAYFAMAQDGVFFKSVATVHPRTQAPVIAIVLQGAVASILVLSGTYERILAYVVAVDWLFFGLTALALMVFRQRAVGTAGLISVPGHPFTTLVFVAASWIIVASTVYRFPANALAGLGILAAGVPVYYIWQRRKGATRASL